jgi:TolB-like protein
MTVKTNSSRITFLLIALGLMLSGTGIGQAAARKHPKNKTDTTTKPLAARKNKPKQPPTIYPVAIFTFLERGDGVKGYGQKVSDILFASLATQEKIHLVDRADVKKLLEEQELNVSGIVAPGRATHIGHLTGAKILVTGSVIEVGDSMYLVAKIIGTETSRVLGQSVKGRTTDDLATLAEQLGKKVATSITAEAGKLVAKVIEREDRVKELAKTLGKAKRPTVLVRITERHVGQSTHDPAAQTELLFCCTENGFEVIDAEKGSSDKADVIITGEGISEFAGRHGNLISVKSRLELKATNRATDKVMVADRQVTVAVGLTEQIAGKRALAQAAMDIALRMLPKVVKRWNKPENGGKSG